MKLKIKASAKIKRRYLLLQALSREEVEKTILDYIGILGWAKAEPVWVDLKVDARALVLSVSREALMNVRAAFEASSAEIKVLRVSGTLAGLKNQH